MVSLVKSRLQIGANCEAVYIDDDDKRATGQATDEQEA
jgi:hypothetical protein